MRVTNMESTRTYNKVANQFVIYDNRTVTFQSYASTIARIDKGNEVVYIGRDWDYSRTTGKYRNAFFDEFFRALNSADSIRKALKDGVADGYKVVYVDKEEF